MKSITSLLRGYVAIIFVSAFISCGSNDKGHDKTAVKKVKAASSSFTIGLKALGTPSIPLVQSGAWAIQGNKLLLIGGRLQGFHGITLNDTIFNQRYANRSIWVINLSDFSYSQLNLNIKNPRLLPLSASSMEFVQDNDSLYIVGGYGINSIGSFQSNYTFRTIYVISVSAMINAVETQGNPEQAIIAAGDSPVLQVTGGALFKTGSTFYLMFGQNYPKVYNPGTTGTYTNAIRVFSLNNNSEVTVTSTCTDTLLHRRDLNAVTFIQQSGNFFAGLGGVFTPKDDGYQQPVYYFPNGGNCKIIQDTLKQLTNQYTCAQVSIYDAANNTHTIALLGGIGKYMYNPLLRKWQNGDNGAKLPFVKSITQMICTNNVMQQKIQLPPSQPEMPYYIGANAIFIPDSSLLYQQGVIDYSKITADTTVIGLLYGGIQAQRPTSGPAYPTSVNKTIYQVLLYRDASSIGK
jgi:hypothetical protein